MVGPTTGEKFQAAVVPDAMKSNSTRAEETVEGKFGNVKAGVKPDNVRSILSQLSQD